MMWPVHATFRIEFFTKRLHPHRLHVALRRFGPRDAAEHVPAGTTVMKPFESNNESFGFICISSQFDCVTLDSRHAP